MYYYPLIGIAMKKLLREARIILLDVTHRYWNRLDPNPAWNQALICIIYKKGKQDEINNYSGVSTRPDHKIHILNHKLKAAGHVQGAWN
jgi:hypothetical protein